jgi:hypothetical protein
LHSEGKNKLAAKDYPGALEKLKPAHEIMRVPTTGVDLAKAQEGLGLLVEARSTALEVANMEPKPSEPPVFAEARVEAGKLADELAPRIPSLVIKVGPAGVTPVVTVDGSEVRSALGLPRKVNPGNRTVVVTATGYVTETRTIAVKEGETVPVEIALRRAEPTLLGPASGPPASIVGGTPAGKVDPGAQSSGGIPTWAWISGAVGTAALGVAIGFIADYPRVRDRLYEVCPHAKCSTPTAMDQGETYRGQWARDIGVSVASGILGLAGVGTAIAGIVMAPSKQQTALAPLRLTPWAGPAGGGAVLIGAF